MSDNVQFKTVATQSRWRSKVLWVAVIAQVYLIASSTGLWEAIGIDQTVFKTVIDAILQLLVIGGILNSPTDSENW